MRFTVACLLVGSYKAQESTICDSIHGIQCTDADIGYITGVTTHDQCCQACEAHAGCGAWSWNFNDGHCHLHASCAQASNPDYHSGIGSAPSPTPPAPAPPGPSPTGASTIVTFHWNVHWQCAQHAGGDEACRLAAVQRFGELVKESGAQIAAGIEVNGASTSLPGWATSGEYEDAVSVMVAPGWTVQKKGGGQITSGSGSRGVAVMLVTPLQAVYGCPQLCVLGVHPGHDRITGGKSIVDAVCGSIADRCSIAMGDWNVGAGEVRGGSFSSWRNLIGGTPSVVSPDSETCCHPSTCCDFDHAGTNIHGATAGDVKVWGYQLTDKFSMKEEHMPVSVHINLPSVASHLVGNGSYSMLAYV